MKQTIARTIFASLAAFGMAIIPIFGEKIDKGPIFLEEPPALMGELSFSQANALLPIPSPTPEKVVKTIRVVVTAYSSTPEQTDDTPFITASGTKVREGIVAANFLPIGTKIKLPDIYGDKIFVVEDRMHPRKKYMVDIWFASFQEAKAFGAKLTYVEVLEG
ncbi:3D domain-containing protein [Patescibacteria group bacterium]|nr:3D domain-containing protein [Patescibacteria group bacterium]